MVNNTCARGVHDGVPNLLALRIASDNAVYHWRFACFCMREVFPDGIDLDVLHVVHVYEFFIDIGAIRARVNKGRVNFARLVADLYRAKK